MSASGEMGDESRKIAQFGSTMASVAPKGLADLWLQSVELRISSAQVRAQSKEARNWSRRLRQRGTASPVTTEA